HNSPTAFNRIVLAVIGRVIQQLERLADGIGKLHHAMEKLLKCCSNFDSIAIIDNKTMGCMVKGVEEPGVARPYSQTSYFSRPCSPHTLILRPSFPKLVHSRESSYFRVL